MTPPSRPPGRPKRGTALPVVLWALVALGALSVVAALAARIDLALATGHRDHAAALGLAEAGVADALAALAGDPARALQSDSLTGTLPTGAYRARWEPVAGRIRITATGFRHTARRTVQAWVSPDAGGALQVAAWREVW